MKQKAMLLASLSAQIFVVGVATCNILWLLDLFGENQSWTSFTLVLVFIATMLVVIVLATWEVFKIVREDFF